MHNSNSVNSNFEKNFSKITQQISDHSGQMSHFLLALYLLSSSPLNPSVFHYQSLFCCQRPEASHCFFYDVGLLQVWLVSCDTLPVLLQPELEARLRPERTQSTLQPSKSTLELLAKSFLRVRKCYLLFSVLSSGEAGGGTSGCFCCSAAG